MNSARTIRKDLDRIPLSQALARTLRIAQKSDAVDLVKWCRLELGGYLASNAAMDDETVVPEYRTVAGQHADIFGRVLILAANLSFIGETRLRNGAEELEALARTRDTVVIHDPHMCELIREHLQVEVYSFRFSVVHLTGVLSAIRMELSEKLAALDTGTAPEPSTGERGDVLELRPNFYGIGVNLRALWRQWKGRQ